MMLEVCKGDYVTPKWQIQANLPGMFEDEVAGEDAFTCSILCVIWVATNKKDPEGEQMEDPVLESIIYRSQHTELLFHETGTNLQLLHTHSCMRKWSVSCKLMSMCTGKEDLNAGRPWVRTKEIYFVLKYKNCTLKPKSHIKVHSL